MKHLLIGTLAATVLVAQSARAQLAEPNGAGVAFGHVHLYVEDVDLHGQLWSELFGGTLIKRDRYTAVQLPGTLIFFSEAEGTTPSKGTAMDHFGLAVRDLGALLDAWRKLGYEVDSEVPGADGAPRAFLTIPGGVRLELREDSLARATAVMDHLHLFAPQNRELMTWYTDLFGATLLDDDATGDSQDNRAEGALTAGVPGSALVFSASQEDRPGTDGTVINHIGFEVDDIDAFANKLQRRGVQFLEAPFYVDVLDLWVAFVNDPAGVVVEITEGLNHY